MRKTNQSSQRRFSIGELAITPEGVLDRVVGLWLKDEVPSHWMYMLRGRTIWRQQAELKKPSEWQGELLKVYPPNLLGSCPTCGKSNDD